MEPYGDDKSPIKCNGHNDRRGPLRYSFSSFLCPSTIYSASKNRMLYHVVAPALNDRSAPIYLHVGLSRWIYIAPLQGNCSEALPAHLKLLLFLIEIVSKIITVYGLIGVDIGLYGLIGVDIGL